MIGKWKMRGTVPYAQLVEYSKKSGQSLDWLLLGRGSPYRQQLSVKEPGTIYHGATDQDIVYTIAADVHRAIGEAKVDLSPEKVATVVRLLHRDMLRAGEDSVPYEKVLEFVRLAS